MKREQRSPVLSRGVGSRRVHRMAEWENALRDAEQKYRSIVENAVEGIFQTTPDGHYLRVNPALARIYGYDTPEQLMTGVTNIDSQIYVDAARRVLFKKLLKKNGEVRDFEYEAWRRDGTTVWVSQSARVVKDADGRETFYEGTTIDITRRKLAEEALQNANTVMEQRVRERTVELARANEDLKKENEERARIEKELRESELRYRTVVELSPEVICVCKDDVVLFLNSTGLEFAGVTRSEDIIGKPFVRMFQGCDEERAHSIVERMQKNPSGKLVYAMIPGWNGKETYVEIWSAPILHLGEGAQLIVIRDITDRKEAENKLLEYQRQLQSLASELTLVQAEERRRMATSLHDNIGQTLALLRIKLQELKANLNSEMKAPLDGMLELAETVIQETRSLTMDLSPPILYDLGFEAAVEWLADRMSEKHGMNVTITNDKVVPKPLREDIKVVLFQSLRELLTNCVKHAHVKNVSVTLERRRDVMHLRVAEKGCGFDTSAVFRYSKKSTGFGLFNIRERLHHLGASIEIRSTPGWGTAVLIKAPLNVTEQGVAAQ